MGCSSSKSDSRGGGSGAAAAYAARGSTAEVPHGPGGSMSGAEVQAKQHEGGLTVQVSSGAFDSDDESNERQPQGTKKNLLGESDGAQCGALVLSSSCSLGPSPSSSRKFKKKSSLVSSPSMKGRMGGPTSPGMTAEEQQALRQRRERALQLSGGDRYYNDPDDIFLEESDDALNSNSAEGGLSGSHSDGKRYSRDSASPPPLPLPSVAAAAPPVRTESRLASIVSSNRQVHP